MAENSSPAAGAPGSTLNQDPAQVPAAGMGQAPGPKGGVESTPDSKKGDDEPVIYTKAQVEAMLEQQAGKLTRQHSKKMDPLVKELEELKKAKLTEPEKMQERLTQLERETLEKDLQIAEVRSNLLKREKLDQWIKEGKISIPIGPDKLPTLTAAELMQQIYGTEEDEIEASLAVLAKIMPPKVYTPGAVPGTQVGPQTGSQKIYTKAEVLDLQKNNPAEYNRQRETIIKQMADGLVK